jgi:hypothetical protein
MSSIALTYDSRQDRLLLKTGLDIANPVWWITRRETKKLLKRIYAATNAQYETTKLLEQFNPPNNSNDKTTEDATSEPKNFSQFHQEQTGEEQPTIAQSRQVSEQPDQFPLAVSTTIDLNDKQGIKLVILDVNNKGICDEFTQQGLFRFSNMLTLVAEKAFWI